MLTEDYWIVMTTVETQEEAQNIAQCLVKQQLAGCVQTLGPMVSTYWWDNKINESQEWLCLIKTSKTVYPQVQAAIQAIHPYDVPEIIATPIVTGSPDYLSWLGRQLVKREGVQDAS